MDWFPIADKHLNICQESFPFFVVLVNQGNLFSCNSINNLEISKKLEVEVLSFFSVSSEGALEELWKNNKIVV